MTSDHLLYSMRQIYFEYVSTIFKNMFHETFSMYVSAFVPMYCMVCCSLLYTHVLQVKHIYLIEILYEYQTEVMVLFEYIKRLWQFS